MNDANGSGPAPEAPANLHASRKEQAALRKAATAKASGAQTATSTKAPAKKAAAKKPASGRGTAAATLRWQFPSGYVERATTGQTAAHNGGELSMKPGEKGWTASFTKVGKTTVLAEGVSAARAYAACVGHAKKGA